MVRELTTSRCLLVEVILTFSGLTGLYYCSLRNEMEMEICSLRNGNL